MGSTLYPMTSRKAKIPTPKPIKISSFMLSPPFKENLASAKPSGAAVALVALMFT